MLLAVIGRNWLTVADSQGKRRLDDPSDFVRLETATALKRDIPVVPVLVQDAPMPRADQLPADLQDLAFRNSVELSHARWDSDVELLVGALRKLLARDGQPVLAATAAQPRTAWSRSRRQSAHSPSHRRRSGCGRLGALRSSSSRSLAGWPFAHPTMRPRRR